jgi:SAM-dependent methyltransferase
MILATMEMHCPVCSNRQFSQISEIFDDRYGEPNLYHLASCISCGHLATTPRLMESDLPGLYGNYYPRKSISAVNVQAEAEKIQRPFAKLLRWWNGTNNQGQYLVRAGETMLDVGCGSGTSLLEAQSLGATAFGIEADPNVAPIASALGLTIHFGSLQDQPFPDQQFDLIVMNQVIEHLPEPGLALQILLDRLKPGGRMVLVFPNQASLWRRFSGDRWINWHIPYHLHHFTSTSFTRMASHCGFAVASTQTITPNLWTLLQLRANRIRPLLGQPSPLWCVAEPSTGVLAKSQKKLFRTMIVLTCLTMFGVMNRIVDVFGFGDSLMVELRRSEE